MENTERFTGKAEVYAKARPGYPDALYESLLRTAGLAARDAAADVGCGTGLFARGLLDRGLRVYGVEPNGDMRTAAVRALSGRAGFRAVEGDASDTTLPAESVSLVTAAQAFHWFDAERFARECRRILRPGGRVALVWNARLEGSDFVRENRELFCRYCPEYHGFSGGRGLDRQVSGFFRGGFQEEHFPNDLHFDRQRFLDRCRSASYSLPETHPEYEPYMRALGQCFDRHAKNGVVTMPNEAVLYLGAV